MSLEQCPEETFTRTVSLIASAEFLQNDSLLAYSNLKIFVDELFINPKKYPIITDTTKSLNPLRYN